MSDCRLHTVINLDIAVIIVYLALMAPIVVRWYLPFFRKLNLTSAYECLEVRFNLPCRLFAFDWTKPCFWVVFLSGMVANLASYTSDHCVVQRYMTTPDEKSAAKSILFNGVLSFFNCFVFFSMGVALWTFYQSGGVPGGHALPVGTKPDAVLPIFVARELPTGISGLVLAAVAAATMSTLSANLNSAASAITTDFYRRLRSRSKVEVDGGRSRAY